MHSCIGRLVLTVFVVVPQLMKGQTLYDDYRFSAGTLGVQFSAQKNTSVRGALIGAASFLKTEQNFDYKVANKNVYVSPVLEFFQAGLYGVYYPWARKDASGTLTGRHWKLVGGVGARFSVKYTADATVKEKFYFAGSTLSTEQIGYVRVNIRTLRLQPYMGIGYETFIAKSPLGLFFDLGTYYHGKPWVSMTATGMLSDNTSNQQKLQNNLNGYRWYPNLMMGFIWRNKP